MDRHVEFKNTLASNLTTSIKANVFYTHARKHESSLAASLFEQNVPVEVFHNLINTFKKHLPVWHRYFEIKRKALGQRDIAYYDMWAPLTKKRPQVSFQQAVDMISESLAPMGKDYVDALRKGCLEERWVDWAPNKGKQNGAFSYGAPGTYPFIMMSFTDEVGSLSTLAHELGHSMHSYLTWKNQPLVYADYSLFVAEVASNFHQAMMRGHLLKTVTDNNFQITLIEEADVGNFFRYFFQMPTLARFELETHERIEKGDVTDRRFNDRPDGGLVHRRLWSQSESRSPTRRDGLVHLRASLLGLLCLSICHRYFGRARAFRTHFTRRGWRSG